MQFQKFCKNMICSLLVCLFRSQYGSWSHLPNAQFDSPYFAEESFVLQDETIGAIAAQILTIRLKMIPYWFL